MNIMSYRGYSARIEFDDEDGVFVGHLAGINDIIGFHADTVAALRAAFHETVDDYLETCRRTGQRADKPYSGQLMVRVDPKVHAKAAMAAELAGVSLSKWTEAVLRDAAARATEAA